jgi:opacity protein-like surface antigen
MWKDVFSKAALVIALAFVCCPSLLSQSSYSPEHREFEVTVFAGTSLDSNFEFPTPVFGNDQESSRTVGMHYNSGYLIGARVNQNLDDFWAVDLEYTFSNQRLTFNGLLPNNQSLSFNNYLHYGSYNVSFLPLPRTSRFRPYGNAGIGFALFYIPSQTRRDLSERGIALRDSWEFLLNWGGGLKYLAADQFALTFDVKDRLSRIPSYGIPPTARIVNGQFQPGMAKHGVLNNWQFNFGLTYQWDE